MLKCSRIGSDGTSGRARWSLLVWAASLALFLSSAAGGRSAMASDEAVVLPRPSMDVPVTSGLQKAVMAGGCFWGVQGVFQHVHGVTSAVSGYAGGAAETAHYERVGSGTTGHAEAVEVTFDPQVITFGEILQIYFSVAHDPTQLNRQGPDVGPQYRSAIFPLNADQRRVAEGYILQLGQANAFSKPIVTTVETSKVFYPAEDYHQDYLVRHPDQFYIVINDLPKIEHLKALFPNVYQPDPVLVAPGRS
jgi:peptide-methionine (S)-S-oxide reductase